VTVSIGIISSTTHSRAGGAPFKSLTENHSTFGSMGGGGGTWGGSIGPGGIDRGGLAGIGNGLGRRATDTGGTTCVSGAGRGLSNTIGLRDCAPGIIDMGNFHWIPGRTFLAGCLSGRRSKIAEISGFPVF
jgi:hypothetical protein